MQPALLFQKRLRVKTSQQPQAVVDDWAKNEVPTARRSAWLVTFPHPQAETSADGFLLRAPETVSKQELFERFHDSCQHPDYLDHKSAQLACGVLLDKTAVFSELHKPDPEGEAHGHAHLAVLAETHFRYLPVKRSLLKRHGLASHWSPHDGYWTAFRYGWMPSPTKLLASLDRKPFLWASGRQHPTPHECCNAPMTALALQSRRRYAEERAAEEGKTEPKMKELDIYGLVVEKGFRNSADDRTAHKRLIVYGMDVGSKALQDYLWKQRAQLPGLIDDIWSWHDMKETLAKDRMTRVEALHKAADSSCVCQGRWLVAVMGAFMKNGIDVKALCQDVYNLLKAGRSPDAPILVLAGLLGGEGKSIFFKALISLFGEEQVFGCPAPGNYPLLGLMDSKVCFWDEWRFSTEVIPWAIQCLLYDGSTVTVNRPQNVKVQIGHAKYTGSSPVFVTTKLADMRRLEKWAALDPSTGAPYDADASMILRRCKVYPFTKRIDKPTPGLPYCKRCFAELVVSQGSGSGP